MDDGARPHAVHEYPQRRENIYCLFDFDFVQFQFEAQQFGQDARQGGQDDDFYQREQVRVVRQTGDFERAF